MCGTQGLKGLKEKRKDQAAWLTGLKEAGRLGSAQTWLGLVNGSREQATACRHDMLGSTLCLDRRTGRRALAAHSSFSSFFLSFPSFLSPMDRRTRPKGGGSVASGEVEPWWSSPGQSKAGSRRQVRPRWRQGKAVQGCGSVGVRAKHRRSGSAAKDENRGIAGEV